MALWKPPSDPNIQGINALNRNSVQSLGNMINSAVPAFKPSEGNFEGLAGQIQALRNKSIGGSPMEYEGVFRQGYKNLGQPTVNPDVVMAGTRELADAFIERYQAKTGQLPDEAKVSEFVAGSLTPRFAEQYISGGIPNRTAVLSTIVDPYMEEKGITGPGQDTSGYEKELRDRYAELYGLGKQQVTQDVEDAYGQSKGRLAEDLAGQGLLSQPTSRISLDRLDAEKGRSLSRSLAELSAEQAKGGLDVAQTIQGINEKERRAREDARRYNKNFQEDQYRYGNEQGLRREEMAAADALGRAQASAGEKDWLDYLNTGLNVAGSVSSLAGGPVGKGIGVGLQGLGSLIGSMKTKSTPTYNASATASPLGNSPFRRTRGY